MTIFQTLYKTYDSVYNKYGFEPLYHMLFASHVEMTLNLDTKTNITTIGSIRVLDKNESKPIQVTEESMSRSSNDSSHALCDQVKYLTPTYLKDLNDWIDFCKINFSSNQNEMKLLQSVYDIVSTQLQQVKDLIDSKLKDIKKIYATIQGSDKCSIAWTLMIDGIGIYSLGNNNIHNMWIGYYQNKLKQEVIDNLRKEDWCYISNEKVPLAKKHRSFIRSTADRCKLISADKCMESVSISWGRFSESNQICSIGISAANKFGNTLRYLFHNQTPISFRVGKGEQEQSKKLICWKLENNIIVSKNDWVLDIEDETIEVAEVAVDELQELNNSENNEEEIEEEIDSGDKDIGYKDIGYKSAKELRNKILGFNNNEIELSNVYLLALDSVGATGRVAITMYRELNEYQLDKNLNEWYESNKWTHTVYTKGVRKTFIGTRSLKTIVEKLYPNSKLKVKTAKFNNLIQSVFDNKNIPEDILITGINLLSKRMSFKNKKFDDWQETLNIVCGLYRGKHKGDFGMALDTEINDRSYLFGRLTAVYHYIENYINKERATNAEKLFCSLINTPGKSILQLRQKVNYCFDKLKKECIGLNIKLTKIENEINDKLSIVNITNEKCSGAFLLGYSHQINSLYTKSVKTEQTNNE